MEVPSFVHILIQPHPSVDVRAKWNHHAELVFELTADLLKLVCTSRSALTSNPILINCVSQNHSDLYVLGARLRLCYLPFVLKLGGVLSLFSDRHSMLIVQ